MSHALRRIQQWSAVDFDRFHNEIIPQNQPAHIKSLVKNWPSVKAGSSSTRDIANYITQYDAGSPVAAVVGDPRINGRFFYREDLMDVNFTRANVTVSVAMSRLIELIDQQNPHAVAVQAIEVTQALPGFAESNPMPLLEESVAPTMWFGNRAMVAPHYDIHDNMACVVHGSRKFTLFPPDQINNLYIGPSLGAPGGVPISMVDLRDPDLERFPRFEQALESAQEAELEPGDALFIPALWWHAVESLEALNVLVNYWWGGLSDSQISPNDTLTHGMLTIAGLDPVKRAAWRSYFDYYVFRIESEPTAHLPPGLRDIVTSPSQEQKEMVLKFLAGHLQ